VAVDFNPLDKKTAAPTSTMKTSNRFQVCYFNGSLYFRVLARIGVLLTLSSFFKPKWLDDF